MDRRRILVGVVLAAALGGAAVIALWETTGPLHLGKAPGARLPGSARSVAVANGKPGHRAPTG